MALRLKNNPKVSVVLVVLLVAISLLLLGIAFWQSKMLEEALPSPKVIRVSSGPLTATTGQPELKFTAWQTNGDLGGAPQADERCAKEYPGHRFCTTEAINALGGSLPDPMRYLNPFVGGWINDTGNPDGNCGRWSSGSEGDRGGRIFVSGSTVSRWWIFENASRSCDNRLPLCCYRP